LTVLKSLGDVLTIIAPEATAVAIVGIVFKLITHAIDDRDKWRRLMFLVVPLLAVALTLALILTGILVWWLLGDGGLPIVLHRLGLAATPSS
jgi:hypothetical protein